VNERHERKASNFEYICLITFVSLSIDVQPLTQCHPNGKLIMFSKGFEYYMRKVSRGIILDPK
jgi:hypothetical protein